jgi:hypothetical protein
LGNSLQINFKMRIISKAVEVAPRTCIHLPVGKAAIIERGEQGNKMTVDLNALETGLMNAVKPVYRPEEGEYVLWCGMEHQAQAILDAAKAYLDKAYLEQQRAAPKPFKTTGEE